MKLEAVSSVDYHSFCNKLHQVDIVLHPLCFWKMGQQRWSKFVGILGMRNPASNLIQACGHVVDEICRVRLRAYGLLGDGRPL
jgi:hypothetical protein